MQTQETREEVVKGWPGFFNNMPGLPRVLESAPQTRLPLTIADQTEPPDGVDAIANRVKEANEMAAQRKILRKQTLTEELGEKRDVIVTRLN